MVTKTAEFRSATTPVKSPKPVARSGVSTYIFCAGMPRSGSTWQYQIVAHLLEEYRGGVRGGFLERLDDFERIDRQRDGRPPWLTLKTHNGYPAYAQAVREGRALVVYSYRDLRDVAYSLMHKMQLSFEEVVEKRFLLSQCLIDDEFWRSLPGVLCQRYEDIMADPVLSVKEIAEYLSVPLTDAEAEKLAANYSLEANRSRAQQIAQQLREQGLNLTDPHNAVLHDERSQLHWNHIRQGRVGGWRQEATPEQLVELATLCGAWLLDNGYEANADWVLPGVRHLYEGLAKVRAELQTILALHNQTAKQLNELNELGPFALGVARQIHRLAEWCPRGRALLKRLMFTFRARNRKT